MSSRKKILFIFLLSSVAASVFIFSSNESKIKISQTEVKSLKEKKVSYFNHMKEMSTERGAATSISRRETKSPRRLSSEEKVIFFKEVSNFFSKASSILDKESLKDELSNLNERGEGGVYAIVEILQKDPTKDSEVEERLPLIDYLVYRSRFDPLAKGYLERLASKPIEESTPLRYRAMLIADKAEMLGGLAGVDWESAAKIILSTKDNLQRSLMANEAYYNLVARGASSEYAADLIKEVHPSFNPNS
ncbi:MAG: hypothetical protein HQK54_02905 [Oligoflexales bacterium]|nr:hypothetical protein [Oligoflexales bacterium]